MGRVGLLCLVAANLAGAAQWREIHHVGAGYIGPGSASDPPETSPCTAFGYVGSAGFPFRNRSVAVDLGDPPPIVHRIVLIDDYSDNGGDSPVVRKYGLQIYTSDDNRNYTRYRGPLRLHFRSAAPEGGFDAVVLDDLVIRARYIKLHAEIPDESWDLGNHHLNRMVRVFQDVNRVTDMRAFEVARYVAAPSLVGRVRLRLPVSGTHGGTLRLSLTGRGGEPLLKTIEVPIAAAGKRERTIETTLPLADVPPGPATLRAAVLDSDKRTLGCLARDIFVCSSLSTRPAGVAGETLAGRPGQVLYLEFPGNLAGMTTAAEKPAWFGMTASLPEESGHMGLLVRRDRAAALRIPLPVSGWHAVSLGLAGGDCRVRVRLLPDGPERVVRLETWSDKRPGMTLGETLIGCRNLDRASLEIAPVGEAPARLAYIRLLGLSDEEIALARKAAKPGPGVRRVIIHSDGFSGFFSGAYSSPEALRKVIARFAGTPIYSFDWCVGGSSFTYATRVGTVFGSHAKKMWRQGDKQAAEILKRLIEQGHDPLRIVVEEAHRQGIPINATLRMNADYGGDVAKTFNGEFYWKHLDQRIVNRNGSRAYNLSYAYPEVRDFRLAIIREVASNYDVDGIHLNFLRHPPFFGYDPPLVAAFRKAYGTEPKKDDPRWHRLRADIMTAYIRRIRRTLDEIGQHRGRRIALSATMNCHRPLVEGLDVQRWVRDGLVDLISPGVHGLGGTYFPVRPFAAMTKGTSCKLFPMLECTIRGHDPTPASERGEVHYESEHMTLNRFRRRFLEVYREGAQGVYPFNGGDPELVRTLSHVDALLAWERFAEPLVNWFAPLSLPASAPGPTNRK